MLNTIHAVTSHAAVIPTIDYVRILPGTEDKPMTADAFCREQRLWLHIDFAVPAETITHPMYLQNLLFFNKLWSSGVSYEVTPVIGRGMDGSELITNLIIKSDKTTFKYVCVDPTVVHFKCPRGIKTTWDASVKLTPENIEGYRRDVALHASMAPGREGKTLVPAVALSIEDGVLKARVETFDSTTTVSISSDVSGSMEGVLDVASAEFTLLMETVKRDKGAMLHLNTTQLQLMTVTDTATYLLNTRKIQTKSNSYG